MAFLTAEQKKEQGLIHAGFDHAWMIRLLLIRILARNIILRHLVCANFPLVSVPGVFHPLYHVRLKRVPFPEQLVHTLRIRTLDVGQSLQISRLLARLRSQSLQCECHSIHALAFHLNPLFIQLFLYRLLRRRHFLAHSSPRLRVLHLGFLFGSHRRSLPPVGHSQYSRMIHLSTVAVTCGIVTHELRFESTRTR